MPVFRRGAVVNLARGRKAFLNLEAGVTDGVVLAPRGGGRPTGGIPPERMVWIFGTGRTGSTWLAAMMDEPKGHHVWFEPRIGALFDPERFGRYKGEHFVLGDAYREVWLGSIRNLVLDGANARFPEAKDGYLVVKEPGGSEGVGLIMEALPESGMVLLIRDPRDVAASWMDAARKGGWQSERRSGENRKAEPLADRDPDGFVTKHARAYLRNVGNAKRAYDAHEGRKFVVKYEDLRADALGTMRRMYAALGVPVAEEDLSRIIRKHAWENIPEDKKGEGKFYRKATPGGWEEDLTPRQARIVERITAPLLDQFYPNSGGNPPRGNA